MSCVLRIATLELSKSGLVPYRVENGTAHFQVSLAGFEDLGAQITDAIAFLDSNEEQLRKAMSHPGANGVLDFAVEWREAAIQCNRFSSELVRAAGRLGLALELSHYPGGEVPPAEA